MKVLYASHHLEQSGWGEACRGDIEALVAAGVNVVARPVVVSNAKPELSDVIKACEDKDEKGCEVVVQHVLPHLMTYNSSFVNVGRFESETNSLPLDWFEHVSLMDYMVPVCTQQVAALNNTVYKFGGKILPYSIVNHSVDTNKIIPEDKLPIRESHNTFVFYWIGEFIRRKNLISVIRAFHTEFDVDEPVSLVIKTNSSQQDEQTLAQLVNRYILEAKNSLRIRSTYKPEVVITNRLTPEEMWGLHRLGDCFVMGSYGESCCLPILDALQVGNRVLCTSKTGMSDYVGRGVGKEISSQEEQVFGITDCPIENLYTGDTTWQQINVPELMRAMRYEYENKPRFDVAHIHNFSRPTIGKKFKEALEKAVESKGASQR